jgi:hypothetical protein
LRRDFARVERREELRAKGEQESLQDQSTLLVPRSDLPEVRRIWHNNEWHYAVVDFMKIWTESEAPLCLLAAKVYHKAGAIPAS